MPDSRFHLGWFMNFTPDEWNDPFASGGTPWTGEFYMEMAKALERACFDYIMIEDTLMVSDSYGGTMEAYLKHARWRPSTTRLRSRRSWRRPPPGSASSRRCRRRSTHRSCWLASARRSTHRRGALRLEHRDLAGGPVGAELRHGQAHRARPALRRWPTSTSTWCASSGTPGSRTRSSCDRETEHVRRLQEGPPHQLRRQVLQVAAAR